VAGGRNIPHLREEVAHLGERLKGVAMRVVPMFLVLAACGPGPMHAGIFEGEYTTRTYLEYLAEDFSQETADDYAAYLEAWADTVVQIDRERFTLTVDGITVEGDIVRAPQNDWKRMCMGATYRLNPSTVTKAEWFDVVLDEPTELPGAQGTFDRVWVQGWTQCGMAQIDQLQIQSNTVDGFGAGTDVMLVEPER